MAVNSAYINHSPDNSNRRNITYERVVLPEVTDNIRGRSIGANNGQEDSPKGITSFFKGIADFHIFDFLKNIHQDDILLLLLIILFLLDGIEDTLMIIVLFIILIT